MRKSIVIIEDFYADVEKVRAYALRQRYYYPYDADADVCAGRVKARWKTSWFKMPHQCPFKSSEGLLAKLAEATGDEIDLAHWNMGFPLDAEGKAAPDCTSVHRGCLWNCSFHFKPDTGQRLGEGVHNHVTDIWNSVGDDGWAGLIYLNESAPPEHGLKLWRNRDPRRRFDWMTPKENWELIDDLGNLPNRLILCRGDLPHSGASGWDDKMETGRLYQTFFFKVKGGRPQQGFDLTL